MRLLRPRFLPTTSSSTAAAPPAGPAALSPPRGRWRRWAAAGTLTASSVAALLGCQTLETRQRQWIFQPGNDAWWAGAAAAEGMTPVWIDFSSKESGAPARLHGLWLPADDPDAPVLLYLHGARWNVTGSAGRMRRMQALGFSVLGIDYRGFGESRDGSDDQGPSEARAYEDARAAWDWLGTQHPGKRRYVFGHSLGSAIGVQLASEVGEQASGLIVEGSFPSIPAVVSTFRWGWLPVAPLITQRFDAASRIARVKAPVLVVHGSDDQLIQPALGRALFEQAPGPKKKFVLVEGGSHHSTNSIGHGQYATALKELFGPRL